MDIPFLGKCVLLQEVGQRIPFPVTPRTKLMSTPAEAHCPSLYFDILQGSGSKQKQIGTSRLIANMPRFHPLKGAKGQKRRNRHLPLASLFQPSENLATKNYQTQSKKGQRSTACNDNPPIVIPEVVESSRQELENITMDELIGVLALSRKLLKEIKKEQTPKLTSKQDKKNIERKFCPPPPQPPTYEMLLEHRRRTSLLSANETCETTSNNDDKQKMIDGIPDFIDTSDASKQQISPRRTKSILSGFMISDVLPDLDSTESSLNEDFPVNASLVDSISSSMLTVSSSTINKDCRKDTEIEEMSFFDALSLIVEEEGEEDAGGTDSPVADRAKSESTISLSEIYMLSMLVLLFFLARNRGATEMKQSPSDTDGRRDELELARVTGPYYEKDQLSTPATRSQSHPDMVSMSSSSISLSSGMTELTNSSNIVDSVVSMRPNRMSIAIPSVPESPPLSSRSFYQR